MTEGEWLNSPWVLEMHQRGSIFRVGPYEWDFMKNEMIRGGHRHSDKGIIYRDDLRLYVSQWFLNRDLESSHFP